MDYRIILVVMFSFIITLIGTLAYSVRLVSIRTGKVAVSGAIFNILVLVSSFANTFKAIFLTNYVEVNSHSQVLKYFYVIIIISGIATIVGALLIPSFQRMMQIAVIRFSIDKSIPKLLMHSFSKNGIIHITSCMSKPAKETIRDVEIKKLPKRIMLINTVSVSILVVGGLAPIYAGMLNPELRATCLTLAGAVNGIGTMLLFIFVNPYLSIKTDEVIDGSCSHLEFQKCVVGMVGTKIAGTFLAVLILIPISKVLAYIANLV